MKHSTTAAVVTAGVLLVGGLGGCSSSGGSGGESPSPQQTATAAATPNGVANLPAKEILDKARTAAESAASVNVKAATVQDGQKVNFDLTVSDNGAQGTFDNGNVGSLQLVATPDMIYVKGNDAFNQSYGGEAGAKLLAGKWLAIPADDPQAASFAGFSNVDALVGNLLQTDATSFTKEGTKDVDGVPTVGVKGDQGTLWVATVGEPYPLMVSAPEGEEGSLTMSAWNAPVTITAPPSEEVVDLSQLSAATGSPSPSSS